MDQLLFDIITTVMCSLTLTWVFYLLYRTEKQKYLLLWCCSFLFFSFSFFNAFCTELGLADSVTRNISLFIEVLSGIFMLGGTYGFVYGKPLSKKGYFWISSIYVVLILFLPMKSHLPELIAVHVFVGFVQIFSGMMLVRHINGLGGKVAGTALFFWGMHRLDFILTQFYPSLYAAGYQVTIFLTLVTTFGILLMHFERVKSELKSMNEIFRIASENNRDIIFKLRLKPDKRFEFVSPSVKSVLGYLPEEFTDPQSGFPALDDIKHLEKIASLRDNRGFYKDGCYFMTARDGSSVTLEISSMTVDGADGTPEYVIGIASDITERSRAFDIVNDRKQWYEEIFNNSRMMVMLLDSKTMTVADCSQSLADYYCMRKSELKGFSLCHLFESVAEYDDYVDSLKEGGEFACRHVLADGGIMHVTLFSSRFVLKDSVYYYVTVFDNSSSLFLADELSRISNLHRSILESLNEGVVGINRYGEIFFINSYALSQLGYEADELLYKNHHDMIHGKSVCSEDCRIMKALSQGRSMRESRDMFLKKDGAAMPVKYNFSYLKEKSGAGIIIFRDITEDLAKENTIMNSIEQNRLLTHELHHRVKNNFQVISSLLAIHADTLNDGQEKQFLYESISKIQSMALIHETLYQNESLTYINASKYFESLLKDLRSAFSREDVPLTIMTDIENINMHIDETVPCALIINELFTNSVKHARPDTDILRLSFSFRNTENGREMIFADNGVLSPDIEEISTHASYGMKIIRSLVRQLKGTFELETTVGYKAVIKYGIK